MLLAWSSSGMLMRSSEVPARKQGTDDKQDYSGGPSIIDSPTAFALTHRPPTTETSGAAVLRLIVFRTAGAVRTTNSISPRPSRVLAKTTNNTTFSNCVSLLSLLLSASFSVYSRICPKLERRTSTTLFRHCSGNSKHVPKKH